MLFFLLKLLFLPVLAHDFPLLLLLIISVLTVYMTTPSHVVLLLMFAVHFHPVLLGLVLFLSFVLFASVPASVLGMAKLR